MTIEIERSRHQKFEAELDGWTMVIDPAAFEPSRVEIRLFGKIIGDQARRFPDGTRVLTSPIRSPKRRITTGSIVRSGNTRYRLLARSDLPAIEFY